MTTMKNKLVAWLNRIIQTKIWHVLLIAGAAAFIVIMAQVQFSKINAIRVQDVQDQQTAACQSKVESRDTVRTLFLGIYDDVEKLFPGSQQAHTFAQTGRDRINSLYPSYPDDYCAQQEAG